MATIPALVLSIDEVRTLLSLLGAEGENYRFSREQYTAFHGRGEARILDLIDTMQNLVRQDY